MQSFNLIYLMTFFVLFYKIILIAIILSLTDLLFNRSDDTNDGIEEDASHIEVVIRLEIYCLLINYLRRAVKLTNHRI